MSSTLVLQQWKPITLTPVIPTNAMELASPFPISIVLEEDAWPSLRDKVLKEGVQL